MLKEQLLEDFKNAMKEKNELKKNTIMMIRSAILQVEKDTQKEMSENEIIEIISKELKKRKESLADYEKSGREDLIQNINDEMAVIKAYLPEELSREEIEKIIVETIAEIGAVTMKDMGKVMQAVKPKMAGRADNKLVNEIVKAKLG
ncbi:MAG: GatB/YqeY domain-containing protein [Clostridia bacterium]|nr:GatB/YqeY domain-containing protein [Clostridia bacterium]